MASVCGWNMHIWRCGFDVSGVEPGPFFRSIGHELCDTVRRLGDGVEIDAAGQTLQMEDRVTCYVLHAMWEVPVVLAKNDATMSTWAAAPTPPGRMASLQRCLRANPVSAPPGATICKVSEEVPDDLAGIGHFDIYIEEACNEAADWFLKLLSATE